MDFLAGGVESTIEDLYRSQAEFANLLSPMLIYFGWRICCENLDSSIGVYASDAEGYKVFSDLLDPIIKEYHKLPEKKAIHHPHTDFGNLEKANLEDLDPDSKFIVSSRIRIGRSQDGSGFPPLLDKESREQLETKAVEALNSLGDSLKGTYHQLASLDSDTQKALADEDLMFDDSDKYLKSAGGCADWPAGRGIFLNEEKNFVAWVNEEDHLRLFSTQKGGDIGAAYKRLVNAVKSLEQKLSFAKDDRLGYLTFCPSNLGTTMHVSAIIKIPHLAESDKLKPLFDKLNLNAAGVDDEDGTYHITNKRRMGLTEFQVISEVYQGLKEIIKQEKELAWRPENVDEMFEHLSKAKACKSLLKKNLNKDVFEKLKDKKTSHEATLGDCIISGTLHLDSVIGIYAADAESYTEFAPLFDPVIKEYHKIKVADAITHPAADFGDLENLGFTAFEAEGSPIVSTRIAVSRSHKDFAFSPVLKQEDRTQVEQKAIEALNSLENDLKGSYHSLEEISTELKEHLQKEFLLFSNNDKFLKAAGSYSDWPAGRGVFVNEEKTFVVWVNAEDHLTIFSTQTDGDIVAVYKRLVTAVKSLEEKLTFSREERLGNLTICPGNLGTALRASVIIKIPHLSARKNFKAVCENHKLQAKALNGETSEDGDAGLFEISNKRCVGITEIDALKEMVSGVQEIVRLEKEAANNKPKSCTVL
ncbi:Arginine kinase [Plakobranchus ocellatus]|uniref:Arginine kinase n=1 Tax=Plakobranchus ocellatus TaxID=259542 RepID=A0AAV3ZGY8_9GAST|nr:Arginine kinase [Plakobranchus ocellatus]